MSRHKLGVRKITITLHRPEAAYIGQAEADGYNVSEILRELIRKWGADVYPPTPVYAKALEQRVKLRVQEIAKKEEFSTMSNEHYAEHILKGQVRPDGRVAFRVGGGREVYLPLQGIKDKTRDNTSAVDLHWQMLERTFRYGDRVPTESEWFDIWEGWDEKRPNYQTLQQMGLWPVSKYWEAMGQRSGEAGKTLAEAAKEAYVDPEDLVDISTEE